MKRRDYTRLGGFLLFFQVISILYLLYLFIFLVSSLLSDTSDLATNVEYSMNIIFCLLNIYLIGIADCRFRTFYWIITISGSFYLLALTLVASYISEIDFVYYLGNLIFYCIVRGLILLYLYRSKRAAVYFHFVGPVLCAAEFGNDPIAHTSVSVPSELPSEPSSDPAPAAEAESPKSAPGHCRFRFFPSMSPERRAFLKGILCTLLILLLVVGGFFGVQSYQSYIRSVYDDGFVDGLKTGYDQGVAASSSELSSIYRRAYKSGFLDSQQGNPYNATPPASIS